MSELTGQFFAGFEILARLGQGGVGMVYKARQPKLNRLVALKVMSLELARDPDFVARFKREAAAAVAQNREPHPDFPGQPVTSIYIHKDSYERPQDAWRSWF